MEEKGRDWKRLANYVVSARVAAGYETRTQFVDAIRAETGTMTERTIGNLERGTPVNANTLAAVELTLAWVPGSCEAILRGGTPQQLSPDVGSEDEPEAELRGSLRVLRRALVSALGETVGREKFFQLVDEMSQPATNAESDQSG